MFKTFFFRISKKGTPIAHNVTLESIVEDDDVNGVLLQKQAEYHAKFLHNMTGQNIYYWPKGEEHNTCMANSQDDSKGGAAPSDGQENHTENIS